MRRGGWVGEVVSYCTDTMGPLLDSSWAGIVSGVGIHMWGMVVLIVDNYKYMYVQQLRQ